MGEVTQPRTDVGSGSVGGAPGQRSHLALAAPAAEYAQQFERLGFEHQPHRTLANGPRTSATRQGDRARGPFGAKILDQHFGQREQAAVQRVGVSVTHFAERVEDVVLVRADVEDELAAPRSLDERLDAGTEPFVDEAIEWAIPAVRDVAVDPRLGVGAGHAPRTEIHRNAGDVGHRVVNRPCGAGRHRA